MFAAHSWPRFGNACIQEVMRTQRDVYAYMNNEVLHQANLGVTINEIHNTFKLPDSLKQQWTAHFYHGSEEHNVRAVLNRYFGYWDANPATLMPLSPRDSARSCRKSGVSARRWPNHAMDLDSEQIESLREGRLRIPGILRLSFAHHVDHLDSTQHHPRRGSRLEAEHRPNPPLDSTMILLDAIVEVGTLPDSDRLQLASRPILKPVRGVTSQDRFTISLTAVDHDPLGPAVSLECLAQKPLSGRQITSLAQPELDGVAVAVDGPVQVHPSPADFDVGLIDMPLSSDGSLASMKLLQQQRRVMDCPAMDSGVIDRDAALSHHLFQVPQDQIVSQIPPDAQEDHRSIRMPALEHATLHP
jgi:hypothetical protein